MIDLRSDLVSVPTDEMWEAMRAAELGWATVGEDASVNAPLRARGRAARQAGGDLGADVRDGEPCRHAHVLRAGRPRRAGGGLARAHLRGDGDRRDRPARAAHRCGRPTGGWTRRRSRSSSPSERAALLILENTHTRAGGTTLSVELTEALAAAAKRHDCRVHIDGARLVNASVALGVPLADARRSGQLDRALAEQGPLGADGDDPGGERGGRRAGAADAAAARWGERAPGGDRGRRRARRPGDDDRPDRGRPPSGPRARRGCWRRSPASSSRPEVIETNIVLVEHERHGPRARRAGRAPRRAGRARARGPHEPDALRHAPARSATTEIERAAEIVAATVAELHERARLSLARGELEAGERRSRAARAWAGG